MRLKFDLNVGALYISLSGQDVARTREVDDNTSVDLDEAGNVVGIEVISIRHPWPLAEILNRFELPAGEEAQLRTYFQLSQTHSDQAQEVPKISIARPAPAKVAAAA